MEIDAADGDRDQDDSAAEPPPPRARSRGRRLPGVAAALSRPLLGSGLAHWGAAPPPRDEPVDVTGPGAPGRLPTT